MSGASGVALSTVADCASLSPSPGSTTASPKTPVTVRGVQASSLGSAHIAIVGTLSGRHTGRWIPDPDGLGARFAPQTPFTPGEWVTVALGVPICRARGVRARFEIALFSPASAPTPDASETATERRATA